MREKSKGVGVEADAAAEVPTRAPSPDNNSTRSRQQQKVPALQLSSSMLSLRGRPDEEIVEQKLSEKLMEGFLLLEKACPCCATPLVKKEESVDLLQAVRGGAATPTQETDAKSHSTDMSTGSTLQATVTPIVGIPFCVTCQAHIVTNEVEAVTLQERYAGKTVQGKIMVAISNGGPSPIPTSYSGRSVQSQASKQSIQGNKSKNVKNIRSGSTEITETRDELSSQSGQSKQRGQKQQTQVSPALLTMKDTIEMFRSESSLCAKRSVPDRLTSPLSRPSISNMSSPNVGIVDKLQESSAQKRGSRLAPAFAIAHGGGEEIEIICAESTQWFSSETDDEVNDDVEEEEDVETMVEEAGAEPKQEEEMTMFDEDDDEDSLKVLTSQDGPCETEAVNVPELKPKKSQESSGHRSKHSTSSHPSKRPSKSDRSKPSSTSCRSKRSLPVPRVEKKEPDREYDEAQSKEEMDHGKKQQKEKVTSEQEAGIQQASDSIVQTELRGQTHEVKVANETPKAEDLNEYEKQINDSANEEVTEPAKEVNEMEKEVILDNVVDDHDDIHEISVDHKDMMVGSGEELTTEGSHLVDHDHDDECWPSYEERKAVATKVLGVKIMQGYSLVEKQCPHCTMPLTEYKGFIDCFVCPVLEKKVAKAKQHRTILEREMSRVKLETQMMEQRKTVQANKNKLLEKTKRLGKTSSMSSSAASAKASSNSSDKKIKEHRTAEQASPKPSSSSTKASDRSENNSHVIEDKKTSTENNKSDNKDITVSQPTTTNAGNLRVVTSQSNITSKAANSSPASQGNGNMKSPEAVDGGNLRIVTNPSNSTLKASNSSPAAEGNNTEACDVTKATPTSQISNKTAESNQSKTIVKAINTMSTSSTSSNASNQSKPVVMAQSVLSTTTAASSVASNRSKVVVKATSLLSAATVASTQASSRSNVIRIDSLLSKSTMPCSPFSTKSSPASARSKTVVKAIGSLVGAPTAVTTKGSDSPASAKSSPASVLSKTVVKANSLIGVPTAVSTKGTDVDQSVDGNDSACNNDVTEKASDTETKSTVEDTPPVKSEDSMIPTLCLDSGAVDERKSPIQSSEPNTKASAVSDSEKKSKALSLRHSASTQLAGVTKNATITAPKSSPDDGLSPGTFEGFGSRPPSGKESRERGLPIRPVMALVKVSPQPAPVQRKRNKNALTQTAISTINTTPQASPEDSGHPEQKLPSAPQPSEDSSKFSSAHSDSTISTKSKISRSNRHVAIVDHDKDAEAETKLHEKVNLAIGPTDIRSFDSDDSSEKNLSITTPADRGNCMAAMFNAAIGTLSGEEDSIMPPTQHELHKLNLEEIRLLKEAIQAEKAMRENGIEQQTEAEEPQEKVTGAKSAERKKEREKAKEQKVKSPAKGKESDKVSLKPLEEAHFEPNVTQEVTAGGFGQTSKREEVKEDSSTKQVENAPETTIQRKKEKSVENAPEMTEDKKSPKSNKEESPELSEKICALAEAIAEADKTAIAEAESIVRSFAEDYHDDQSRTSSLEEIRRQQWETLRLEGRSAMTRRSMTGWTVSSEFCRGKECGSSPLVVKGPSKLCVVCGGTGTGNDGVYDLSTEASETSKENFASNETSSEAVIRPPRFDFNTSINLQAVKPPVSSPLNEAGDTDTDTESKMLIRPPRISGIIPPDSDSVTKPAPLDLIKPPRRVHCDPTEVRMVAMTGQHSFVTAVDGKEALENIESKRTIVSKEIGKRMLQGWKLLNLTCPTCHMPLMIDENDEHEICVLCGLVSEGIQSTGTLSTMQPTLSFKSTEDNDSYLTSPISSTALVPGNHNLVVQNLVTRQDEGIHTVPRDSLSGNDSAEKLDETLTEIRHKESRKLPQRSPRKSSTESPRKSKERKSHKKSSRKSSKDKTTKEITEATKESLPESQEGSPRKSKKSTRKSSKEETEEPIQGLLSIGHLEERIRHRANTPRGDPPAARGHDVVRKSMLEADAMKAGDLVVRFDVKDASPVAADNKACGPSPSKVKAFDCDPPKENLVSDIGTSPLAENKACGPSPSINKIFYFDHPHDNAASAEAQLDEKKPDAPSPHNRQESSAYAQRLEPPIYINEWINNSSLPQETAQQQDSLTLEIPKGFDVNDEAALRQLIAQTKLCRPLAKQDVRNSHVAQTEPGSETQFGMINQDERWSCHLPSPGLTGSPPGSLRVDIETTGQHSEPTMEGSYHLPSPGISEASLPLKSPASSYRPRSIAPELLVRTSRSQLRPRITPERMDRTRPSSRSRSLASSRSKVSSVGEASDSSSSTYRSFAYVGHMYSHSQSRTSRNSVALPGAYSSYRVERKTPESPEIIVIGGPLESREVVVDTRGKSQQSVTSMDDLVSLGKSVAATSVADSISTAALDALLARIEQTKFQLDAAGDEEDGVEKHEKIAGLLQELSSAAAQMEMLDDPSATSTDFVDTPSERETASSSSGARRFRES